MSKYLSLMTLPFAVMRRFIVRHSQATWSSCQSVKYFS